MAPSHHYLVTCVPGLEDITRLEVEEVLDARVHEARRGRVRFSSEAAPRDLRRLRSIEHRMVWLGAFRLDGEPEAEVRRALRDADLASFTAAVETERSLPPKPSFRITGRREGTHPFTSEDVQRWAGASVVGETAWPVDLENHDLDIYVRVEHEEGWIGGRLPGESCRRRPWQVRNHPAALNPVIAHGMARLAEMAPGHRVLDPFCGSGTLLIECGLLEPGVRLVGADRYERTLPMARDNSAAAGVGLRLAQADARRPPWRTGSFDRVVSNMPFGRRSGSHRSNRRIYFRFFDDLARILAPGGRAVLLTLERRLMETVLSERPLAARWTRRIHQSGLEPILYCIEALGETRSPDMGPGMEG